MSLDWEVLSIVFHPVASPLCALNTEKREDACVSRKTANALIFLVMPFASALADTMN